MRGLFFVFYLIISLYLAASKVQTNNFINQQTQYRKKERASLDDVHQVIFYIKELNMDKLSTILNDVSNPDSINYGKYLSKSEVVNLIGNPAGSARVRNYLKQQGVKIVRETRNGEYITAKAKVSVWEAMLSTEFFTYEHVTGLMPSVIRTHHYTLDESIADDIRHLFYVSDLPYKQNARIHKSIKSNSEGYDTMTISLLNSYYNIFTNQGYSSASQTIYSSIGKYFSAADINAFQILYGLPIHPVNTDVNHRMNDTECIQDINNCAESDVDLEYIMAVSQYTNTSIM